MTENNKSTDEEYKYPEEEYVVEPEHSVSEQGQQSGHAEVDEDVTVASPKRQSMLLLFVKRNKRMLSVLAVAVIALIVFQVMKYQKNNKVIKKTPVVSTQQAPQKVTQTLPAENTEVTTHQVGSLQQIAAHNATRLTKMQEELQSMHSQLDLTNETNQRLQQAMVLLAQELKAINAHLSSQPKTQQKKPSGPPKPEVIYQVRAMVDNRAWIAGSNGLTESVTVGDPVPNYGLVTEIDPVKGVITTTSGKIIKLGYNDF